MSEYERREYIVLYECDGDSMFDMRTNERIVRCRDCRAMRVKYGNVGIECWMSGEPFTVEPDGYCAWGIRRQP